MIVYALMLYIPIYIYLGYRKFKQKNIIWIIPFIYMFILAGLRGEHIGMDYPIYIRMYRIIANNGSSYMEIGWQIFNKIIGFISKDYHMLGLATSFVILSFVFLSIKKLSYSVRWIAFLIYICNPYLYLQSNFNIMRQGMAMAIVLYSFTLYINSESIKEFVIGCIVASTIHSSAIFLLIIVFFIKFSVKKKFHYICASVTLLLSFLISDNRIISFVTKYIGYNGYNEYEGTMFNFSIYKLFIFLIIIVLCINYDLLYKDSMQKVCVDIYIFSLCLLELLLVNDIAYRIYLYFALIHVIIVPMMYSNINNKNNKLLMKCVVIGYYVFFYCAFFYSIIMSHNTSYVPYVFWG